MLGAIKLPVTFNPFVMRAEPDTSNLYPKSTVVPNKRLPEFGMVTNVVLDIFTSSRKFPIADPYFLISKFVVLVL